MKPLSEVFEIRVVPLDLFVFARTCALTVRSSSRPIGWRWFSSRGKSVRPVRIYALCSLVWT